VEHIKEILSRRATANIPNYDEPRAVDKLELLRTNIRVASLDNTFENFKRVAGTEDSLKAFESLVEGKEGWKMLLCYGGVGNGKTHLLEAFAIEMHKQGRFARVLTMGTIMSSLKRGMDKEAFFGFEDRLDEISRSKILLVDDVGMGGSGSEWEWGQLEDIIGVYQKEGLCDYPYIGALKIIMEI